MVGFLLGSAALIALEVLLQPSSVAGVRLGSNVIGEFAQRWLSPQVAGLPDFSARTSGSAGPYDPNQNHLPSDVNPNNFQPDTTH